MHIHGWAIADKDGRLLAYPAENALPFAQRFRVAIVASPEQADTIIKGIEPESLKTPEDFEGAHAVACTVTVETYDPYVDPPKADDLGLLELRHRLKDSESSFREMWAHRRDAERKWVDAQKQLRRWAMAIADVGRKRFTDKEVFVEAEAILKEIGITDGKVDGY